MNRQRFTRSSRINFLQISLFLFGHFFEFGPGAARTQHLAPDALHLSAFALSLSLALTQHTLALAAASHAPFCLRCVTVLLAHTTHAGTRHCQSLSVLPSLCHCIAGPHTTHTGTRRCQSRSVLPLLCHCIAGPPTLSLSLEATAVQSGSWESVALRVRALQGVANLLQYNAQNRKYKIGYRIFLKNLIF
jgi:hypothetical protein